jgi:hypothetical protein
VSWKPVASEVKATVTFACPCGEEVEFDELEGGELDGSHVTMSCDGCGRRVGVEVTVTAEYESA